MSEWKTSYDYPGMSNCERLAARHLQVQDDSWNWSKIFIIIFIAVVLHLIINGDVDIRAAIDFYITYIR